MQAPTRAKWEYRVLVIPVSKDPTGELDRLGSEGWELVSTEGVGELGAVEEVWCFMKRSVLRRSSE